MAIWHQSYPQGVPPEVDTAPFETLDQVLREKTKQYGHQPSFSNMGTTLSYVQLDRLSDAFASYLVNGCGLQPGDRIALQMPNLLQYPIALFGAIKAGLVVVNTNPLYTDREMEHQFKDSGAKAIVILANFAHNLEKILGKTQIEQIILTEVGDMLPPLKKILTNFVVKNIKKMVPPFKIPNAISFQQALEKGKGLPEVKSSHSSKDIAFLQYTGGTTGVSKGAVLTHSNVIANMAQIAHWMKPLLVPGQEIILTPLPLYHIFSLSVNCLAFMNYGAHNVLITNPRDIPGFIKTMKKYPFSVMSGVNTLFNALLNHPQIKTVDFSSAKVSVAGAMALQDFVAKRWLEVTGTKVIEGYGLTEASPVVCCNPVDGSDERGSIGPPLPSTEVTLRDEDGKESSAGEPGELCVRGPQVMQGYWQRPEASADVIKDGWLYTGDVAVMDEKGYFKIVDRKKDMILVSGFNVYPNEIEDVIASHPAVLEVAAVGVPHEKSGEAVKVFIVKSGEISEEEVIAYCREEMTGYKVPKFVEFRDDLPKSNVGKILRRKLRETPVAS